MRLREEGVVVHGLEADLGSVVELLGVAALADVCHTRKVRPLQELLKVDELVGHAVCVAQLSVDRLICNDILLRFFPQ